MATLEDIAREAWPAGAARSRPVEQLALCRVQTYDTDTERDVDLADRLELANRRALDAWLRSGRSI